VSYDLTHTAGVSASGVTWTPSVTATGYANVSFGVSSIVVPAGGSAQVEVTITADAALAEGSLYGGYIVFTPKEGVTATAGTLRVPYAGFKGDYQLVQVLTTPPAPNDYPWLASFNGSIYVKKASGTTYTLQSGDIPYLLAHFNHAARQVKVDVYDSPKGKYWGRVATEDYIGQDTTAAGRQVFGFDGHATLNKQTVLVPNGAYVLKIQVLKALGDESNPAHWETWTTPVFNINHP
jgi:minor extracellular serine protease Vpr